MILFIWYLLINISLMTDLIFVIFIWIFFIFTYIFYIYKSKNYINLLTSIIILFIYSISYSYININLEDKLHLENKNISINKKIERYTPNCIKNTDCDLKEAVNKDIKNINKDFKNPSLWFYSIRNIDYILNGILINKEILKDKWYLENINIEYNRVDYLNNIIQSEYSSKINNNYFIIKNNLFYNQNQFKEYQKEYYNFIYDEIINWNIWNIINNKFENKKNIYIIFNRKFFYNYLNNSQNDIIYFLKNIDKIEEKIKSI